MKINVDTISQIKTISYKIRKARKDADMSQNQLARMLGISGKTVSAYESGRALPPIPTLAEIAKITLKDISYFLEDHDPLVKHMIEIKTQLKQVIKLLRGILHE